VVEEYPERSQKWNMTLFWLNVLDADHTLNNIIRKFITNRKPKLNIPVDSVQLGKKQTSAVTGV